MIDHIGLRTHQMDRMRAFYAAVLAELGYALSADYGESIAFGEKMTLWISASDAAPSSTHLAFQAPSRDAVERFHAAALKLGAGDHGAPGLRPHYHEHYYAAFVIDPDGNNIEAVCHDAC
ncbi:VOC family protein [Chromobacterium sp. IIBBL 290-4]|uniref:VOC family protein n=1 Tax=Chromobacterium sp. IIBBL 290-4 TaxID=2953890 RepID=UPI0020B82EF8|nr:VOC family protein [Chromobacterium sp. IIBBL 290-4]UTH75160.1 VOC family protein [Chromobacterium sp. IIBBL 290-4]